MTISSSHKDNAVIIISFNK